MTQSQSAHIHDIISNGSSELENHSPNILDIASHSRSGHKLTQEKLQGQVLLDFFSLSELQAWFQN